MRLADPEIRKPNRQPADKEQHAVAQRLASNDQSSGSRGRPETGPVVLISADRGQSTGLHCHASLTRS
jgi:hypothetical protein